jgi:ribosomal protein S10
MNPQAVDVMADNLKSRGELSWESFDKVYLNRGLSLSEAPLQLIDLLKLVIKSNEKSVHIDAVIKKLDSILDMKGYQHQELTDVSDEIEEVIKFTNTPASLATDSQKESIQALYTKAVENRRKLSQLQPA